MGEAREPGWYPDVATVGADRWWDGVDWTEFTRATPPPAERLLLRGERPDLARPIHLRESNGSVLAIALSPLWISLSLFVMTAFSFASPLAGSILTGLPIGGMIALFLLAARDRETLRQRGARDAASPLWMLFTPLGYLIGRWSALRPYGAGGGGWIVLIGVQGVLLVGLIAWWTGLLGLMPH
ncbi:DUF2510 domain-containing protein [Salinibacterium sp. SYSU T00001]|uniref:DUF2510 domain-containing protein n=1 Tax=Homoserinimonas sedimenticola TaxID=2986805 RepID=UPI0022369C24|nr:DUF2510 domain-containing protein [Salinibacterium sedimenticola]MCW4385142.1 DUF2510 domain-containing protein [Salinibacterium sedimenticola]